MTVAPDGAIAVRESGPGPRRAPHCTTHLRRVVPAQGSGDMAGSQKVKVEDGGSLR